MNNQNDAQQNRKLKVLVLGGSRFVGWYITQKLLERGHEVSVFNRGKSNTDLPEAVEQLRGDRNTDRSSTPGTASS